MGLFDDIGSALEGFGAAKDEAINQAGEHLGNAGEQLGNVVPEEVQNITEMAQDPLGQLGDIIPGQGEDQQ